MRSYAEDFVTIAIVDLAPENPPTGTEVNTDDVWKFKVKMTNHGDLNLTGVKFHIHGRNGAEVSESAAGPWGDDRITTGGRDVDAHESKRGVYFYFKAPA